jgi:hypothetical protein
MFLRWHPLARNREVSFPLPRWGSSGIRGEGYLERAHIPSPRESLEEYVRLMIMDLGIPPACDDWQDRLTRTEAVFREHRG